jgi:hypothetical protein
MTGRTTKTAPKRIWLQVNPDAWADDDDNVEDQDEPFPAEDVTWCPHSIGGLEVEYVRADLVQQIEATLRDALTEIRDRIVDHPAYDELTLEEEIDTGGDTAELSYLARVANEALNRE